MTGPHPFEIYAVDTFDERIPVEDREEFVAARPHEDAVFDCLWWSRHGRYAGGNGPAADGWRFAYACEHYPDDCPDAISDMAAASAVEVPHPTIPHGDGLLRIEMLDPDRHPKECPDCGGTVHRLSRAWAVPLRAAPTPSATTARGRDA